MSSSASADLSLQAQADEAISAFAWGEITEVHRAGPYLVVEYLPNRALNAPDGWEPSPTFSPYVEADGSLLDMHHSYGSLDEALVAAIAYRNESLWDSRNGLNSQAAKYFMRMILPAAGRS